MASAAAVAADDARSPIENDLGADEGVPGEITSGVYSKDDDLPDINGDDEDEDDDLPSNPLHKRGGQRRRNGDVEEEDEQEEAGGDDLFGDEEAMEGEDAPEPRRRQLDDAELDSGDDMDRTDRMVEDEEPQQEYQAVEKAIIDLDVARLPAPEPSDGEMYLLKVPTFMAIEPRAWDHKTFQPPTTDHHSTKQPTETFSAYNTALSTIRWRHSPSDLSQLQSNARINRWSDGSLTLQLASDPTTQYEIEGNALAPPQRNPLKPTPTSIRTDGQVAGRRGDEKARSKDAYTYLVRPNPESSTMLVTHKITAGLSVKQSATIEDDAIERLQASLAAATNASKVNGASGISLIQIDTDPEAAKKEAMEAIKQQEKDRKKLQAARDREAARSDRVLGRTKGLGANRYSGLNVGMLEDDEDGGAGGRSQSSPNKARKPRRRRNSEYSEDEDYGRKRFAAEDEYEVDDFVAPSDEEEVVEDDDDSDDGIVEEPYRRDRSPKRDRPAEDEEADAPGEEEDDDEEADVQTSRAKRRRIVDDEDEE